MAVISKRYLGIDVGAETVKIVEISEANGALTVGRRRCEEHHKSPSVTILRLLEGLDWGGVDGAAATGRFASLLHLPAVPVKGAQLRGLELLLPEPRPVTVVSIGGRGFSVLELRAHGSSVFRENSRCSQGTGNFLRQLVERFGMTVEQASVLCADVPDPAALSGRCPVILKTDMTHLANKGERKDRILAGLYDAVCENVQVLIKPQLSPPDVVLIGGVARAARIRDNFRRYLQQKGMRLIDSAEVDPVFLEATGAALEAVRLQAGPISLERLIVDGDAASFETIPALASALPRVHRLSRAPLSLNGSSARLLVGFDIGSTGSKAVALDLERREPVWESYRNTEGDPVGAAQDLVRRFLRDKSEHHEVLGFGVTGSGREIVGSLLATCYGAERVFILNEIAAHATGATHYDPTVDTIFEIGGQDAKYVRLSNGQVYDAAMNEACSAGTGSFIEEQGKKFQDVSDVVQMGQLALTAASGISLGQHCSVFMAEVIDAAVAAGHPQPAILAGIYDSIIQNYLNRVKGNRSVGQRIFCQGMPFASDALAAAVARQTGRDVVIPPNPGTVGALGIALLAAEELAKLADGEPTPLQRLLEAHVREKNTFICKAAVGCGEPGNRCRIDRLSTVVEGRNRKFCWGGGCSLWDRGISRVKLPNRSPDPFRERDQLIQALIAEITTDAGGRPRVAMTDEFVLKNLFPFFATFVHALGFAPVIHNDAGHRQLKRGIESANVPYCAPLQLYSGIVGEMAAARPEYLLMPMLRDVPRLKDEPVSCTCPLSQASGDLIRFNLGQLAGIRLLTPVIDMGCGNLDSEIFIQSCLRLAADLGADPRRWETAFEAARAAQRRFEQACLAIGRHALAVCQEQRLLPVVVLGRSYTIYNGVLNSNVPTLLREQGAIAIPVDCLPLPAEVPVFEDVFWGYSQQNLRAAWWIRQTPGIYSIFCSNYSCGPDSFNLHFFQYLMEGKPFCVIETDGHSGDAGTKTRIEAFLFCVDIDRRNGHASQQRSRNSLEKFAENPTDLDAVRDSGQLLLVPRMGPNAEIVAAALRAEGIRAESLPLPDRQAVRIGRKHTSGKECVPMIVTLGSALQAVEGRDDETFCFFMPATCGPCRFGMYNLLDKVIFERLGLSGKVNVITQREGDFFAGISNGAALRAWAALVAGDLLLELLYDTRPVETTRGAAQALYDRTHRRIIAILDQGAAPSFAGALAEIMSGMFGLRELVTGAARGFATLKGSQRKLPTVALVGEIYVRCDPFTNDFIVEKLEERGLRVTFAPFGEFIEYQDWANTEKLRDGRHEHPPSRFGQAVTTRLKRLVKDRLYEMVRGPMAWPARLQIDETVDAATRYLSRDLQGEAVLTLGGPIHEYLHGQIQGVVNVGPLECMPHRIAESQFFHAAEDLGLVACSVAVNGDPLDTQLLENFAYEVHTRFEQGLQGTPARRRRNGKLPMVTS